ncbi:MAG: phage tail sheath subtilisin-like domain-containing protein [Sphingomonadaceae bacterium]|nr:phage tail sheath subtilisin-like domain-containing protein [Sphingomonadaceae bacterium]
MSFHHGIKVTEINDGARVIPAVSTAIIGLVATADDADASVFPLDRPALVTDIRAAIGKAGTTGTLVAALNAIADQVDPVLVVVRVAAGTTPAATTANVIGTAGASGTGLQAMLAAQAQLGVSPKILGCPGLDTVDVTNALVIVAGKLGAMAYASCDTAASVAEALTYRAEFGARELMLIWPDFLAFDVATQSSGPAMAVARALGLRAFIDQTQGWNKTLSNVPVAGVTGLTADVHWSLQDSSSDADLLNAAGITTLVNVGSGYRFWGNRTCSADPLFAFESATRTAQVLKETIADALLWAMDKPLHPQLARDIIETANATFRQMKAAGLIVDAKATFDPKANPATQLAAGQLVIDYDYTPTAPLEQLGLNQRITDKYYADFAAQL